MNIIQYEFDILGRVLNVQRIKLKTSHPNFLLVGKAGDLDMEFPSCLEVQEGQEGQHELKKVEIAELKNRSSVFSFPEVGVFTVYNSNAYSICSQVCLKSYEHSKCFKASTACII